ncbi:hypothetical protein Tco_1263158 [Tanacetum coccineum]
MASLKHYFGGNRTTLGSSRISQTFPQGSIKSCDGAKHRDPKQALRGRHSHASPIARFEDSDSSVLSSSRVSHPQLIWESDILILSTKSHAVDIMEQGLKRCVVISHSASNEWGFKLNVLHLGSGYHQKGRKPSQNDKTEHGMEKTVQNQGQSPKNAKVRVNTEESAVKPEPELKNTIECNLNPSDGPGKPNSISMKTVKTKWALNQLQQPICVHLTKTVKTLKAQS